MEIKATLCLKSTNQKVFSTSTSFSWWDWISHTFMMLASTTQRMCHDTQLCINADHYKMLWLNARNISKCHRTIAFLSLEVLKVLHYETGKWFLTLEKADSMQESAETCSLGGIFTLCATLMIENLSSQVAVRLITVLTRKQLSMISRPTDGQIWLRWT